MTKTGIHHILHHLIDYCILCNQDMVFCPPLTLSPLIMVDGRLVDMLSYPRRTHKSNANRARVSD